MLRRFAMFNSPEKAREREVSKLRWRDVAGQLALLQKNLGEVHARLKHYGGIIATLKGKLDEDLLSVDKVFNIAKQFRVDTREYTAAVEEVLELLEQMNMAVSTALHQEGSGGAEAAGGEQQQQRQEEELLVRQRVSLSRLVVDHRVRLGQARPASLRPADSSESSSRHSDLGSGIAKEKPKRNLWFKLVKRKVSPDAKSKEVTAGRESEGVTEDKEEPLVVTDESRGVPNDCTASSGDDGQGVSSSQHGAGGSSIQSGGVGEASRAAGGSDAAGDGEVTCEEVAPDQDSGDQATQSEASVAQDTSAANISLQSFHSAHGGDEADCESETTTPAAFMTTDSSNDNGKINANGKMSANVHGNGNTISNDQVSMQSTASQTDEGWIALDCVELDSWDKQSPCSMRHELLRQQVLLWRELQQHAARLESLRLARLHLPAQTSPLRATWLLCAQLENVLHTAGSEVRAAQRSLRMRISALHLLDASDCRSQPAQQQPPQSVKTTQQEHKPLQTSSTTTYKQLLAEATTVKDTDIDTNTVPSVESTQQQEQQLLPHSPNTIYQQLLSEATAVTDRTTVPDIVRSPLWHAMDRAFDFLHRLSNRQ